ncbi:hypothetical protein C1645_753999 [Glomus cerebriforme]|uniref:Uncharacterized protein n=1 Tax=Glomus cerebriforme TaxID=658196 RepID=A0A397TEW7_9GLOM|nr:hypothetical protein C1645_753999 [Glomus cerebriforme]
MGRLANCSNIKYWDDMGGLCLTCSKYGYTPFESLTAFINIFRMMYCKKLIL